MISDLPTPKIIKSVRRTISLTVSPKGELVVKAPIFISEKQIQNFIQEKREWIVKALNHVQTRTVKPKSYQQGEEFIYLGKILKLNIGNFNQTSVDLEKGLLNFPAVKLFRIKKELEVWYQKEAIKVITAQVEYFSKQMKTQYKNLKFSDTSSKWGTCFPDNSLQFNWRLIMAPLMVLNYVVIHELSHTIEKNHGKNFWGRVSFQTPAYKQHNKWLKNNKHLLTF